MRGLVATLLIAVPLVVARTEVRSELPASDGNWPQWRGPDGLGISAETGFATEWSPTKNIGKTAIPGRGHSSPVIWGDHIFLTTSFKEEPVPGGRKAPVHLDFSYRPGYAPDADIEFIHKLDTLAVDTKPARSSGEDTHEGLMSDDHHRSNTMPRPRWSPTAAPCLLRIARPLCLRLRRQPEVEDIARRHHQPSYLARHRCSTRT
jgi:hypothetical protein